MQPNAIFVKVDVGVRDMGIDAVGGVLNDDAQVISNGGIGGMDGETMMPRNANGPTERGSSRGMRRGDATK